MMDFNAKWDIHYNIVRYAEILRFNFFYKEDLNNLGICQVGLAVQVRTVGLSKSGTFIITCKCC